MKVIAKVDSNRVLCEVSIEELAFLNGYKNTYSDGFNKEKMSEVGTECNLKKMVTTSQFVRSMRSKTLMETKHKLEEAIGKIDEAMETAGGLEIFNILADEEQIG